MVVVDVAVVADGAVAVVAAVAVAVDGAVVVVAVAVIVPHEWSGRPRTWMPRLMPTSRPSSQSAGLLVGSASQ